MLTLLVRTFYRRCDLTVPDGSSILYKSDTPSFPASIPIVSDWQKQYLQRQKDGDQSSLGAQAEPISSLESPTVVAGNEKPSKKMELQSDPQTTDEDSVDFDSPDDPSSPLSWSVIRLQDVDSRIDIADDYCRVRLSQKSALVPLSPMFIPF